MYLRHVFAYEEAARRLSPDAYVLDIGCGEGYGTARLARAARCAEGVDVDAATIGHAVRNHGSVECHYQVYDGIHLPFAVGTFDAAVTCQVIEHVPDDIGFVADAARVLRPAGIFILTTPNRLLRLAPGERPWNRYHLREYSPEMLHELLAPHFTRVEVLGIKGDSETQAHELARLAWVRRTVDHDPLGLRRLLPEAVKRRVLTLLRGSSAKAVTGQMTADWNADRYLLTAGAAESLDLFAVCSR